MNHGVSTESEMAIISREEAKLLGLKHYFTGKPCKRGHIDKRLVSSKKCHSCEIIRGRVYRAKNGEKCRASVKAWRDKNISIGSPHRVKNRKKYNASARIYRIKNPEKCNALSKAYYRKNIEKYRERERKRSKRRMKNPLYRLNHGISKGIYRSLKTRDISKGGRSWREQVNFSFEELVAHLERQFTSEMSWENYGNLWHLDHSKPVSLCVSHEETWALSNLQPMLATENCSKGNRYTGKYRKPK